MLACGVELSSTSTPQEALKLVRLVHAGTLIRRGTWIWHSTRIRRDLVSLREPTLAAMAVYLDSSFQLRWRRIIGFTCTLIPVELPLRIFAYHPRAKCSLQNRLRRLQ